MSLVAYGSSGESDGSDSEADESLVPVATGNSPNKMIPSTSSVTKNSSTGDGSETKNSATVSDPDSTTSEPVIGTREENKLLPLQNVHDVGHTSPHFSDSDEEETFQANDSVARIEDSSEGPSIQHGSDSTFEGAVVMENPHGVHGLQLPAPKHTLGTSDEVHENEVDKPQSILAGM